MSEHDDDTLLQALGERARDTRTRAALEPLPDAFNDKIAQQIKRDLGAQDLAEPSPRRPRRWLGLAATVVVAVGLVTLQLAIPRAPALPDYRLEFRGGAQMRSNDDTAPLQMGDRLEVVLRPAVDVDDALDVAVFHRIDDQWRALPANVQWAPSGAARVTMNLSPTAGLIPGPQTFTFVIGRSGQLPAPDEWQTASRNWQRFSQSFSLVP